MKRFSFLIFLAIFLLFPNKSFGQKRSKPVAKRKLQTQVIRTPKSKVEIENWKIFDQKELKIKIAFPKEPTLSVRDKVSYESKPLNLRFFKLISTELFI
jgi:hypothetical protein